MERVSVIFRTTKTRSKRVRFPFIGGLSLHAINTTDEKAPCSHNESGTRLFLLISTMYFEYRHFFLSELLPSITIRTLALVTADFHSQNIAVR